jgi:hypothetical protein
MMGTHVMPRLDRGIQTQGARVFLDRPVKPADGGGWPPGRD